MFVAKKKVRYSDGELEVLRIMSKAAQPCGVNEVSEALAARRRPLAQSTVANRLTQMEARGLIKSVDDRRPKKYVPLVGLDSIAGTLVNETLERVFGGSPAKMILHLMDRLKNPSDRKAVQEQLDKMK